MSGSYFLGGKNMKHHILAKFNESVTDKSALLLDIRKLFAVGEEIDGVTSCTVIPNCIDRPNRYDVMIVVEMDKSALPNWDASKLHHDWKDRFGAFLEKKAIFDCE